MRVNFRDQDCETCHKLVLANTGVSSPRASGGWQVQHKACAGVVEDAKPSVRVGFDGSDLTRITVAPKSFFGGTHFAAFKKATIACKARRDGAVWVNHAPLADAAAIIAAIVAEGFVVDVEPGVAAAVQASVAAVKSSVLAASDRAAEVDARLRARGDGKALYSYQYDGVRYLSANTGALLGDDQGLGKTVQTAVALPLDAPVLVVAPAVAKGVWKRELAQWRPDFRVSVLDGRGSFRWPTAGEVVVTNFDVLPHTDAESATSAVISAKIAGMNARFLAGRAARMPAMATDGTILTTDTGCASAEPARGTEGPLAQGNGLDIVGVVSESCVALPAPPCDHVQALPEVPDLVEVPPANIVIVNDECQRTSHMNASMTKRFRALADAARKAAGRVWLLTGTPTRNKSGMELWTLLGHAGLCERAFGTFGAYCALMGGRQGRFGMEWHGVVDVDAVAERLRRVMLRRVKSEVLKDLPAKRYQIIPVDIDAKTRSLLDTETAGLDIDAAIKACRDGNVVAFRKMAKARAALATAKIPAMLDLIESYEDSGTALVVFSAHRAPIDLLGKREGWATITGDTAPEERTAIEERFQRGELRGVAATIKAGGVAITLTHAHTEIFVDLAWTPADNSQSEDRCYRIGQKESVLIIRLVADHPLDARVDELLGEKQAFIDDSVNAARTTAPVIEIAEAPDFASIQAGADAARAREIEAKRVAAEIAANAGPKPVTEPTKGPQGGSGGRRGRRCPARFVDAPDAPRRPAATAQEHWAAAGLVTLAGLDPDFAKVKNEVGFNAGDGRGSGHWLAYQVAPDGPGLTDFQWREAVKMCRKYHAQIGACPEATPAAADDVPTTCAA